MASHGSYMARVRQLLGPIAQEARLAEKKLPRSLYEEAAEYEVVPQAAPPERAQAPAYFGDEPTIMLRASTALAAAPPAPFAVTPPPLPPAPVVPPPLPSEAPIAQPAPLHQDEHAAMTTMTPLPLVRTVTHAVVDRSPYTARPPMWFMASVVVALSALGVALATILVVSGHRSDAPVAASAPPVGAPVIQESTSHRVAQPAPAPPAVAKRAPIAEPRDEVADEPPVVRMPTTVIAEDEPQRVSRHGTPRAASRAPRMPRQQVQEAPPPPPAPPSKPPARDDVHGQAQETLGEAKSTLDSTL